MVWKWKIYIMSSTPTEKPLKTISSSIHSLIGTKPSCSKGSSTSNRRERIPDKPKSSTFGLWGFLRNCIGKDLSQIAMPVNFSEPLSMLQRLTEDFEYAELLDRAADCSCPYEQLAYLAVFTISVYASSTRTTKPFNPLLGETYEFDRTRDLGWRVICEQVSHHPPTVAQFCEGKDWILWQEFTMESRFTGNDVQVTPRGEANVEFKRGNSFSWNKVVTTVHNFLIGTLWVDQQGEVIIVGRHNTEGITSNIRFIPYNGSSLRRIKGEMRKVKGEVLDANGIIKWKIDGTWDDQVEITPVVKYVDKMENPEDIILGESMKAWKCSDLSEGCEHYYSFSTFACQLNEIEEGIPPTDSRLRPDQRLMEEGKWDEANNEKLRLEEKQRAAERERLREMQIASNEGQDTVEPYQPIWFKPVQKNDGQWIHVYRGNYWQCKEKQDWSMCPDIFS